MAKRQMLFNKVEEMVTCPVSGDIAIKPVISLCCETVFSKASVTPQPKKCPKCNFELPEFEPCPFAATVIHNLFDLREDDFKEEKEYDYITY